MEIKSKYICDKCKIERVGSTCESFYNMISSPRGWKDYDKGIHLCRKCFDIRQKSFIRWLNE